MELPPFDPRFAAELLAALPDGVVVADPELRIVQANAAAGALLGCDPAALIGRSLPDLYWCPVEGTALALADRAARATNARAIRTADGKRRVLLVHGLEIAGRCALVLRDPGDLHDTLDRLVLSESSLRSVSDSSPDGICVHHQGRLVYVNRALCAQWGGPIEELIGRSSLDLAHPLDLEQVKARQQSLAEGKPVAPYVDLRLKRRDGSVWVAQVGAVNVVYEGKPSVLVVARDVTEQRQLQARLGQVDRMVALGTLAAGVAHEIGNPLTYVLLRLDAATVRAAELRRAVGADGGHLLPIIDELAGHVAAVSDGARRVRAIVSELKVFARADEDEELTRIDVTAPLERALSMAAHELKGLTVVRSFAPAPPVMGQSGKLTQVFLNLVLNAVHALHAAAAAGLNEIRIAVWGEAGQTLIAITDTGCGLGAEDVGRVFDPFYATSTPGQGVGLGLAITHAIVTGLAGQIRVESQPGAGATFTVSLPAAA